MIAKEMRLLGQDQRFIILSTEGSTNFLFVSVSFSCLVLWDAVE